MCQVAMTHRSSGGPEAKTVEYLKSKEKKPNRPEESLALQGLVYDDHHQNFISLTLMLFRDGGRLC